MAFIWYDSDNKVRPIAPRPTTAVRPPVASHAITPVAPEAQKEQEDIITPEGAARAYQQTQSQLGEPRIHARDIMTSPVQTLLESASLQQAMEFFQANRFRHAPIVNSDGLLVGVISDRRVYREALLPEPSNDTIGTIAGNRVLAASPDTELREIARVLFEERIGCMPIADETRGILGIITRSDILRAIVRLMPFESWL